VAVRHDSVFLIGIAWLTLLLVVAVICAARARTTAERLVAADLGVLILVGLLGLVAAEDQRSYPLDAALALALLSFVSTLAGSRYLADRRPFDQPSEGPSE
jgi:multicomponent Na+:H+ antiporter subunit F